MPKLDPPVALLLATLLLTFSPASAVACSCAMNPPLAENIRNAEVIFAGEVERVRPYGAVESLLAGGAQGRSAVRFTVSRAWKGIGERAVTLQQDDSAACGYGFSEGGEYLVYAGPHWEHPSTLTADLCGRTAPLGAAAADLAFLGPGTIELAEVADDPGRGAAPWLAAGGVLCWLFALLLALAVRRRRRHRTRWTM